MNDRLKKLGYVLVVIGVVFVVAAGVGYVQTQNGYRSLQKFSEAQGVTLSYNDEGQLLDHGTVEGAQEIMDRLTNEWGYTVVPGEMDPNDPLVNTASEYMYQMATISTHVLDGTQTVILEEPIDYEGVHYEAGQPIDAAVAGRYYSQFDRTNPVNSAVRSAAWSGVVLGMIGELGVGTVTHSALKLALALSGLFAAIGLVVMIAGAGLAWAASGASKKELSFVTDEAIDRELAKSSA
jgi:hypothetical protein